MGKKIEETSKLKAKESRCRNLSNVGLAEILRERRSGKIQEHHLEKLSKLAGQIDGLLEIIECYRPNNFLIPPLPEEATQKSFKTYCGVCGEPMRTKTRWHDLGMKEWANLHIPVETGNGGYEYFPVCSKECLHTGENILERKIQRRKEQWLSVMQAKSLLREARLQLRPRQNQQPRSAPKHRQKASGA